MPSERPVVYFLTSASTCAGLMCLAAATRSTWMAAFCRGDVGVEAGAGRRHRVGRDLRDRHVVELGDLLLPLLDDWIWAGLLAPRLDALEYSGLQP